ncbi:RNA-guided endonuclease InsQ/TnpB family protein [Companilactobacillus alimentarius]|uniref:Transposase n=2 Tax=Companilactobacillus alimentarius TaxID=1602 RepID=A0A2K9HFF7_9LACO|nr:RNA-guided endonuclease TnpB family protein [Companilactobacillus alimentarius]AUI71294.1 transposase [Companilactobacillus alimentarius DSM 20249]GEO43781.1 transposase [Companilactobacillus alimentarius]
MKSMSELEYHYGIKVRIYPSYKQKELIKLNSNISRTIYNKLVGIDREVYHLSKIGLPIKIVQTRIDELKRRKKIRELSNHYQYMEDKRIDSLAKANAVQNYLKAWQMFREVHKAGVPKFHKKGYFEKYQTNCQYPKKAKMNIYSGSVRFLDNKHIQVPKLGKLRIKGQHKRIFDHKTDIRIGTVTVNKDACNRYFVSLQLGSDTPFVSEKIKTGTSIGIDLNTENFLTTSNNVVFSNPRFYRRVKKRLAKEQRTLSRRGTRAKSEKRKLRTSKNYQKQRLLVSQLSTKIKNQRHNFLNKLSTTLINNHDLVVAEELRSSNLLKNHALAMSISDVGWRTFLSMLTYKADLYGKTFITINPKNTTQTCSTCGHVMSGDNKLTLSDRQWDCPICKAHHSRDHNAAINILNKGLLTITQ